MKRGVKGRRDRALSATIISIVYYLRSVLSKWVVLQEEMDYLKCIFQLLLRRAFADARQGRIILGAVLSSGNDDDSPLSHSRSPSPRAAHSKDEE